MLNPRKAPSRHYRRIAWCFVVFGTTSAVGAAVVSSPSAAGAAAAVVVAGIAYRLIAARQWRRYTPPSA
jgi:hypothetical protein